MRSSFRRLNINSIVHNPLLPIMLQRILHTLRALNTSIDTHQIQRCVDTTSCPTRSNDSQTTQHQASSACDRLSASGRLLPRVATLAGVGWATSGTRIRLLTDIRILIRVLAQIESQIIHDVAFLNNIWSLRQIPLSGLATNVFEFREIVWMRGSREAGEHTELPKEEGGGADREDCAFAGGVFLLDFGEVLQNIQRLGLLFDNRLEIASWDNQNIKLRKLWLDLNVSCVSLEG